MEKDWEDLLMVGFAPSCNWNQPPHWVHFTSSLICFIYLQAADGEWQFLCAKVYTLTKFLPLVVSVPIELWFGHRRGVALQNSRTSHLRLRALSPFDKRRICAEESHSENNTFIFHTIENERPKSPRDKRRRRAELRETRCSHRRKTRPARPRPERR